MAEEVDFQQRMRQIETLVHEIESADDAPLKARSAELVSLLMDVHGAGLGRMLELLAKNGAAGTSALEQFGRDPLVASLLLLYGLHPVEMETRVQQALEKVRPLLRSHGGNVELLGINEGVVQLRLQGSCHGCPSSAQTLKNAIEEAVYEFAPDVVELKVEGVTAAPLPANGFVPVGALVQLGNV